MVGNPCALPFFHWVLLEKIAGDGLIVSTTNLHRPGNPATWSYRLPLPSGLTSLLPHHPFECSSYKYASSISGPCTIKCLSDFISHKSFPSIPKEGTDFPNPKPIPTTLLSAPFPPTPSTFPFFPVCQHWLHLPRVTDSPFPPPLMFPVLCLFLSPHSFEINFSKISHYLTLSCLGGILICCIWQMLFAMFVLFQRKVLYFGKWFLILISNFDFSFFPCHPGLAPMTDQICF